MGKKRVNRKKKNNQNRPTVIAQPPHKLVRNSSLSLSSIINIQPNESKKLRPKMKFVQSPRVKSIKRRRDEMEFNDNEPLSKRRRFTRNIEKSDNLCILNQSNFLSLLYEAAVSIERYIKVSSPGSLSPISFSESSQSSQSPEPHLRL